MPRKRKRRKKQEEYVISTVRVEGYDAAVDACLNHAADTPQYALSLHGDDPLYEFNTRLEVTGTATSPDDRVGDTYDVTIYGDDRASSRLWATLDDVHARDEHGARQYRMYRGREIPVYKPPMGIGLLNKVRGEARWTIALFAKPRFVSDMLALLGHAKPLYLEILERKEGRTRWVRSLGLQTSDPDAE